MIFHKLPRKPNVLYNRSKDQDTSCVLLDQNFEECYYPFGFKSIPAIKVYNTQLQDLVKTKMDDFHLIHSSLHGFYSVYFCIPCSRFSKPVNTQLDTTQRKSTKTKGRIVAGFTPQKLKDLKLLYLSVFLLPT